MEWYGSSAETEALAIVVVSRSAAVLHSPLRAGHWHCPLGVENNTNVGRFSPIAQYLRSKARTRLPKSESTASCFEPDVHTDVLSVVQRQVHYLVWQLAPDTFADTLTELDTLCSDAGAHPSWVSDALCRAIAHASDSSHRALLQRALAHATWSDEPTTTMLHGLGDSQVSVPPDADPAQLLASVLDHIAQAKPSLSSDQLIPFMLSVLSTSTDAQCASLDETQRHKIFAALHERYGDTVPKALEQAMSKYANGRRTAEVLRMLGPSVMTPSLARALLQATGFTSPSTQEVASLLSQLLTLPSPRATPVTDFGAVAKAVYALQPSLDARAILQAQDSWPELSVPPCAAIGTGLCAWIQEQKDAVAALSGLWGVWQHRLRQLQLLFSMLLLSESPLQMVSLPVRRIVDVNDYKEAPETVQTQAQAASESVWNMTDLIETLMELAGSAPGAEDSSEVGRAVTAILERAIQQQADCVLLGLAAIPPSTNAVHPELVTKLLAMFLSGHPSGQLVFYSLWHTQPTLLLDAFQRLYSDSALHLTRIVEVAQELNCLDALLSEQRPLVFVLDAAALAARRDALELEPWLQKRISDRPADEFMVTKALDFLEQKIKEDLVRRDPQAEPTFVPLSVQQVATFLRVLRSFGDTMTPEEIEHFKVVRNLCLQLHPRLMSLTPGTDSTEPGLSVTSFSKEIHREADSWYRQMYEGKVSVDDIMALLKRCKHSDDPHEHQLFACMVHTLFDEYRWFELYYPPRELLMTSEVFGSLIRDQLIDSIPLGIAIRYVVDALRSPPDSPMSHFGARALVRFWPRLSEWPQLCQALMAMPTLQQAHPQLVYLAEKALEDAKNGKTRASTESLFTAVHVDEVSTDGQRTPSEAQSDQILFLINNMTMTNVAEKLPAARELISGDVLQWLARYLVVERVSLEPNNHELYRLFLDGLELRNTYTYVLHETLVKLKSLLESEKTMQSSSERTILKNLAAWLGLTTLARQKPIRHRHISFKMLLLQAHEAGRLMVAIPFVCKVLEQCVHSVVFRPPNPWLMAVLSLLVELYQFADLKLNLKFEIEVLCKSLQVDLQQLQPSRLLPGRRPEPPSAPPAEYGTAGVVAGMEQLSVGGDNAAYQDMFVTMLQNMAQYIVISPQVVPYANSAAWKRVMYVALERAIQEIITPVVERSVTIASISTRELVSKDFAMEPDEHKLRTAAHQMAQNMAGSLALVTCKEPLRLSILAHARQLFAAGGVTEQALPEQALLLLVQDNLDLACVVIEKTAMEKALAKVDEGLASAYAKRREFVTHGRGVVFWDNASLSHYSTTLPDMLRIAPPGLQPAQLRVYDNLAMTPSMPRGDEDLEAEELAAAGVVVASAGGTPPARALERFLSMAAELERFFTEVGDTQTLATLPTNHFVRQISPHLTDLVVHASQRDETVLLIAQKVVQLLYKSHTRLAREVWVAVLEQLCEQSPKVAKEVTAWLVYAEDERKFDVPVTLELVRANLIGIGEQEQQLAKLVLRSQGRPSVLDFSAQLARELLQSGIATRQQLATLLSALHQVVQYGRATPATQQLLDELDELAPGDAALPLREQLAYSFASWVRMFQQAPNPEKAFVEYVTQLQSQNVLKGEQVSSLFFRMCTEVSVGHYLKQHAVGGTRASGIYSPIDTYAQLIVYLVKYHADPHGANDEHAKVLYLTKILSIIVLVLAQSHEELGARFQQKPFFRLFSSLLFDLHHAEPALQGAYQGALLAIANALHTLQPSTFPGFAFSWLGLMSHRLLLAPLLAAPGGTALFHRLMLSQLRFLAPFLRQSGLHDTMRLLYTATLRVLLLLLHDAPEYLAEHAQSLSDAIPPSCIQMRNIILCAYPRTMRLPDPLAASVRLATLPEAKHLPASQYDVRAVLVNAPKLQAWLDEWLQPSRKTTLGTSLADACKATPQHTDTHFHEPLMSAMVLYLAHSAWQGTQHLLSTAPEAAQRDPVLALYHTLLRELEPEGRYLLLSVAANQLRFPSRHTAYFSTLLLTLYMEDDAFVREQILRVLLERVIVHRPHPWGVLYTFAQLLRAPKVPLPQAPPEIHAILEHMAKTLSPDRAVASTM